MSTATAASEPIEPYWMRTVPGRAFPKASGDLDADVVIVGAGLTGLWTAHYLLEIDPALDIVILEGTRVGYGASGRNGGWVSNLIPGHTANLTKKYGAEAVRHYRDAVRESVDETIRQAHVLNIDADIIKSGTISVALTQSQAARQLAKVQKATQNFPEDKLQLLSASDVNARIAVNGVRSGILNPHVARVHPGKLVRGLATSLADRGVHIFENTPVREILAHTAVFDQGRARAPFIVRATEGFTPKLKGGDKEFLAMNSSMVLTRPQSPEFWNTVGWTGNELLSDAAHDYVYGQRTADGRIALGGRGVPYSYANGFDLTAPTPTSTITTLQNALRRMFPMIDVDTFEDTWSGTLAVSRDWNARVSFDRTTGLCAAGGYVGHGVAATNLAGRTLANLITGTAGAVTRLPWVQHTSKSWEPEPLRWLGTRGVYMAYRLADESESKDTSGKTSRISKVADLISGRP